MSDDSKSPPELPTLAGDASRLPRRSLLKWLGVAGAAAATGTRPVLGQIGSLVDDSQPSHQTETSHRLRRWVMAIDLRRCDGCGDEGSPPRCTQACIQMRLVPEGMQWIQVYEADLLDGGTQFLPTPCMQC